MEQILAAVPYNKQKIHKIYCHVQIGNDEAKKFYEKHDFVHAATIDDYYKKITPTGAWVLEKCFS